MKGLKDYLTEAKHQIGEIRMIIVLILQMRASLRAQLVKNLPAMQETPVRFLGWEDPLEKGKATPPVFLGFPCGSAGK